MNKRKNKAPNAVWIYLKLSSRFFPEWSWPGNKVNERKISVFRAQFKSELQERFDTLSYTQPTQQDVIHEWVIEHYKEI